jgi:hypothetical protein
MTSFLGYLKSQSQLPEFWISMLLIGIGGSWVSVYLVRWSDRFSRSVSRRWGERTEAKSVARVYGSHAPARSTRSAKVSGAEAAGGENGGKTVGVEAAEPRKFAELVAVK